MELINAAFELVNLPYTILMIMVTGYWGLYMLGAVGSEALDFVGLDFDADVDVDTDVDADVDADVSTHGSGAGWTTFLRIMHIGELPVMLILSLLIFFMWIGALLTNSLLGVTAIWLAGLLFFPNLVIGLMLTKAVLEPFVPYLKQVFDQTGDTIEIVGKICTITSLEATPEYGQAELPQKGAPLVLKVRTRDGVTLRKGEEAIVYEQDTDANTYLVAKLDIGETSAETSNQET